METGFIFLQPRKQSTCLWKSFSIVKATIALATSSLSSSRIQKAPAPFNSGGEEYGWHSASQVMGKVPVSFFLLHRCITGPSFLGNSQGDRIDNLWIPLPSFLVLQHTTLQDLRTISLVNIGHREWHPVIVTCHQMENPNVACKIVFLRRVLLKGAETPCFLLRWFYEVPGQGGVLL